MPDESQPASDIRAQRAPDRELRMGEPVPLAFERQGVRLGDLPGGQTGPASQPVTPAKTWQDRYGPLIVAIAFTLVTAAMKLAGIDVPPPATVKIESAPGTTVMVAPAP